MKRQVKHRLLGAVAVALLLIAAISYRWITLENGSHSRITSLSLTSLSIALSDCKKTCGRYPTTAEGLNTLFEGAKSPCKAYTPLGSQFRRELADDWGNPITYVSD